MPTTISTNAPPPNRTSDRGSPVALAQTSATIDGALERLRSDSPGERLEGTAALVAADFEALQHARRTDIAMRAAAIADAGSVYDQDDVDVAVATALAIIDQVDRGVLPPSLLSHPSVVGLVRSLDGIPVDGAALADVAGRMVRAGTSETLVRLVADFDLKGASLGERAASIQALRTVDPIGDQSSAFVAQGHRFTHLGVSPLMASSARPPTRPALNSLIQQVATVSNRMGALVDQLEMIDGDGNEAQLAAINAEMKMLQAEFDIILGLIDQLTKVAEKVGQAFSR